MDFQLGFIVAGLVVGFIGLTGVGRRISNDTYITLVWDTTTTW
jgi:hypothetical protein